MASQDIIDVDALNVSPENSKRVGQRRGERLQSLRSAINEWRSLTWTQNYGDCAWGPNTLLPDAVVTKLAARAHISTLDDIKNDIPEWDFVDDYGSTLLELIQKTDDIWKENHAQELQTKKDLRKRRSIENKEQREEERRIKKRAETAQRNATKTPQINTFPHPAAPQPSPWLTQPLFLPSPSTSSHIFPQPLHTFQPYPQPPQFYPQPIFFVPGPGFAQVQPYAESRMLSDLTVTQNQPRDHEM